MFSGKRASNSPPGRRRDAIPRWGTQSSSFHPPSLSIAFLSLSLSLSIPCLFPFYTRAKSENRDWEAIAASALCLNFKSLCFRPCASNARELLLLLLLLLRERVRISAFRGSPHAACGLTSALASNFPGLGKTRVDQNARATGNSRCGGWSECPPVCVFELLSPDARLDLSKFGERFTAC